MEENLKTSSVEEQEMTTTTTSSSDTQQQQQQAKSGATIVALPTTITTIASSKALKRCLSVPIIRTLPGAMTTRSAAAAAAAVAERQHETPTKFQQNPMPADSYITGVSNYSPQHHIHIGIPRSNPSSREVSPAPVFNIFAPRARRYSASYSSPLGQATTAAQGAMVANPAVAGPLCITPRVSQLRQEECVDLNSREQNHEREVHMQVQMSQSWEDLTLVAENWSCKSDEFSNPLQVLLPSGVTSCSSPSPTTSNRAGLRLPYGLSPSPTRRTFATRRSMSPIAMRPSSLVPVKRKFELDDSSSNWNIYSPPPLKKFVTESRGSSPICQSPSSVCPSPPDSGTYDGRITPKIFISKLCTTNTNNNISGCSSPMSASPSSGAINDPTTTSALCSSSSSSSSSSSASSISSGNEPMCIGSGSQNIDEGISISETTMTDEKRQIQPSCAVAAAGAAAQHPQPMSTDLQDEASTLYAMMDDMKSETSSIGSISVESSCDGAKAAAASFLNKLNVEDFNAASPSSSPSLSQKNFFINKQSLGGAKKFIVNHDNLPTNTNSSSGDTEESIRMRSTLPATTNGGGRGAGVTRHGQTTTAAAASLIVENKL